MSGYVTMLRPMRVDDDPEALFACGLINEFVRNIAQRKGKIVSGTGFYGEIYRYKCKDYICQYNDSAYGNDNYYFMVSPAIWDEVPTGLPHELIYDEGYYSVYGYQDSPHKQVLLQFMPGSWQKYLAEQHVKIMSR